MSILKVDTIREKTSGNGVAIPDNNNITGFYNNATFAVSTGSFTYMTNWTKMNSTYFGFPNVGTQFSHSGGNFTTTKPGVYKVTLELHMNSSNNARWIDLRLLFTPNGGSAVGGDLYDHIGIVTNDTTYHTAHRIRYFNFTHANDKVQVGTQSVAGLNIRGASNEYDTVIYFEWVAPPQTT